ncbi:hypothetical protein SAMN05216490_4854 [Mucilaginibacter mallensis]|uniref:Uncharacterized protein n=1 Tax=Mucilaginibacter mallensis TaxID=652787 RepID=A0A1H2CCE3_MUCMA|nr:hypothetical protein [Mucilaginibacter mallensis]SDT67994.1 hypothetical protein SAMN05216490_4854 [Mucilaginibacter mallensis]
MKIIILLLLLSPMCSMGQIAHGTSVACFIQDNTIWIAADSKIAHEDGSYFLGCKIKSYKGFVFCMAGIYSYGKDYDAYSIVGKSIDENADFNSLIAKTRKRLINGLSKVIENVKKTSPQNINDTIPVLTTLICDMEKNKLRFTFYSIYYRNNKLIDSILITDKGMNKDSSFQDQFGSRPHTIPIFTQGQSAPLDSNPLFKINSPVEYVYYMVYLRTKAEPKTVGLPISVAMFSNKGIHWYYNDLNCR